MLGFGPPYECFILYKTDARLNLWGRNKISIHASSSCCGLLPPHINREVMKCTWDFFYIPRGMGGLFSMG